MIFLSRKYVFLALLGLATCLGEDSSAGSSEACLQRHATSSATQPFVAGKTLVDGEVLDVYSSVGEAAAGSSTSERKTMKVNKMADVIGCCSMPTEDSNSADDDQSCPALQPAIIGQSPQFTTEQALSVLDSARRAWNGGSGKWTQMTLKQRTAAMEKFIEELKKKREEIVNVLMWEIGKNMKDAESEFDRTISFVYQTIDAIRSPTAGEFNSNWESIGSTNAFVRRAAIGVIMVLGPFNYPLNETYATLIPALLMGNIVIMKVPSVGGLTHLLTLEAFAKALPAGTINFISGSGRQTMPPLMKTGHIDGLAFIGGSAAADDLIRKHPEPHRLKVFLQLEAKNMAIFLPDLFEAKNAKQLDNAIKEAVTGALSYNGQRCTALKIIFAPKSHSQLVAKMIAEKVEALSIGLPWQAFETDDGQQLYSQITPLPNMKRVEFMQRLIDDATAKGATVMNKNGGTIIGGSASTLMIPAVLYPVTSEMEVYDEEQFGPVVPVSAYDDIDTVLTYAREGKYGQQASIFTATGGKDLEASTIIDRFSSVFGKININTQCGRSPDTLPFSGRRSSAMGVMSVYDALREFSVPTVVTYTDSTPTKVVKRIEKHSNFMQKL